MLSLVVFELLHLAYDLLQAFGHKIRPLRGSVISFQVFQEAQKQRINGHNINAEKRAGYEISTNDNDCDWSEEEV